MFPFEIKYEKPLNSQFDSISNETILEYFEQNLKDGGVDETYIEENTILRFKNDYFSIRPGLNWNIWEGIRKGSFEIIMKENQRIMIYSFNISKLIIPFTLIGLFSGVFTIIMSIGVGLFFFAWTLLPWLTIFLRHKNKLTSLLDEVLEDSEQKS